MPTRTKAARPASCFCVPLSLVHHLGFVPCARCYPASYVRFPALYAGLFCSFSGMLCRRSPSILSAFYAGLFCSFSGMLCRHSPSISPHSMRLCFVYYSGYYPAFPLFIRTPPLLFLHPPWRNVLLQKRSFAVGVRKSTSRGHCVFC